MERCPPEILDHIFAHACTDDGQTGRALSLVSHKIRDMSRRRALQSIALYGQHQIEAFPRLLDGRTSCDNHIRHLFLTDCPPVAVNAASKGASEQWVNFRTVKEHRPLEASGWQSSASIVHLLTRAGPSLSTLTLLLFETYEGNILAAALPCCRLDELTVHCSTLHAPPGIVIPSCPTLRRVHVISDCPLNRPWERRTPLENVSGVAPSLTHLRISRLKFYHLSTRDFIRTAIEKLVRIDSDPLLGCYWGERQELVTLPPNLSCMIIQASTWTISEISNFIGREVEHSFHRTASLDIHERILVEHCPD
ncbi:hypothetical protein GY45DRAFT_441748 [Cubamyces sp. BRFM 1775]|nr:hypothetical protein GY45DRAFT_441748 [Cubamyces sp. BRFM 1775]